MYIHRQQANEVIRKHQPNARDAFLLCDVADLPALIAKHCEGYGETATRVLAGSNTTLTAKAERYMHKFEEDVFSGQCCITRDAVVGSFSNIPAWLAGVPCAMRQRGAPPKTSHR